MGPHSPQLSKLRPLHRLKSQLAWQPSRFISPSSSVLCLQ